MSKSTKVVSINTGNHRERVRLARRDALIVSTMKPGKETLVEHIAHQVHRLVPPCFDLDDLIGVGNLALTGAAENYRPAEHGGTPFEAYARLVIRGAMLESIRRKRWEENTRIGIMLLGVDPQQCDSYADLIAEDEMNDEIYALLRMATQPTAPAAIDKYRKYRRVSEAISWLSADQQRVMELYYSPWEHTFADVGRMMGLTERETKVLHSTAIEAIRRQLRRSA